MKPSPDRRPLLTEHCRPQPDVRFVDQRPVSVELRHISVECLAAGCGGWTQPVDVAEWLAS